VSKPIPLFDKKELDPGVEVRWCPGCGDYAILAQVHKIIPGLGIPRENFVFVSGIGCSSRFPYYMNTYGFHTIHGRAPAIATGLKQTRPELSVWMVTGDGDALSIGGNHLIHMLRRNVDVKILLFNNKIYGLTKGQYSPTSELGKKTKSTPMGSFDPPFDPVALALGARATFVARVNAVDPAMMVETLNRAAEHKGTAFVEILQNCNVFNDGAWDLVTEKATKEDHLVRLVHGQPVLFAKGTKGVKLEGFAPKVVDIGPEGPAAAGVLVWDEKAPPALALAITGLTGPGAPMPLGVFRAVDEPTYHERYAEVAAEVREKAGAPNLAKLLASGETWLVS
jgi:2-oxoglutarate/2-oxoacid ferredoxin oxidoreductase subunit beta